MRKVLLIGIGVGDPDYLTVQAIKALNRTDVFFFPDKGAEKASLRRIRTEICDRFIERKPYRSVDFLVPERAKAFTDYRSNVEDWHRRIAERYAELFERELSEGETGGFLVWGDPTLYDSTLRILDHLRASGQALDYEIIPGISSVQALAAKHRIALNHIGEPVLITTGRRLRESASAEASSVVVMLDGERAFRHADGDAEIYWGAYLGTEDEVLVAGRLSEVADEIETTRERERERHGWIMDTYLIRKPAEKDAD